MSAHSGQFFNHLKPSGDHAHCLGSFLSIKRNLLKHRLRNWQQEFEESNKTLLNWDCLATHE